MEILASFKTLCSNIGVASATNNCVLKTVGKSTLEGSVRYVLALAVVANIFFLSSAANAETGFVVVCEPTEQEDVGRVISNQIYDALAADKTIKKKTISVKIRFNERVPSTKTLTQLLEGTGFTFDPTSLALSVGGNAVGHACFAQGTVQIYVKVTRKNGIVQENSALVPIGLPGAYATKARVFTDK